MTVESIPDWTTIQLHEVCRPKQWQTIKKSEMTESGFPVYGANGEIGRYHSFNHANPTILIGCRGSCGAINVCEPNSWVTGNAMALEDLDTSRVDFNFMVYALKSDGLRDAITGTSQPQITQTSLKRIHLPLPPLEEQRRIAAVLDAAEALRAKRRQALAKLDYLTQAIFIDMFGDPIANPKGWEIVQLGEVLESATYGTSKKADSTGRFPVLRMGNLTVEGRLDLSDMKFVDLDDNEIERHTVHHGDVLFNRTNSADLVGKTSVYRLEERMAYAGYLIRLRPKENLNSEYLGTFMNLPTTKLLLRKMCKSIIGMANINAREVQAVKLPLPPRERQSGFATAHADVDQHRARLNKQLSSLEVLFASLQQRAFQGEL